jgi:hypothetical protein
MVEESEMEEREKEGDRKRVRCLIQVGREEGGREG